MGNSSTTYRNFIDSYLTVPGGTLRVPGTRPLVSPPRDIVTANDPAPTEQEPTEMTCCFYKVNFDHERSEYWVFNQQSLYCHCPICNDIHMMWATLESRPDEVVSTCGKPEATTDQVMALLETF